MSKHDIFVIGASSGGVRALKAIAAQLPGDLPAAILIVVHLHPSSPGYLADILDGAGPLGVKQAADDEKIQASCIYVARPDCHLLVTPDQRLRLSRGAKENRSRPAIDPLFRTAALAFTTRLTGIILTGFLDDGAAGLQAVQLCGGITIVQNPNDAEAPGMPLSALRAVAADYCVSIDEMAPLISRLAGTKAPMVKKSKLARSILETEAAIAAGETDVLTGLTEIGSPTMFTCPDCQGVLSRIENSIQPRFRCHTGHAYSLETLQQASRDRSEDALWSAARALQEQAILALHSAEHAEEAGDGPTAEALRHESDALHRASEQIRKLQADFRSVATDSHIGSGRLSG